MSLSFPSTIPGVGANANRDASLRLVGGAPTAPGFVASKDRLDKLRKRRVTRQLANDIYEGRWKRALLEAKRSQRQWRRLENSAGQIETLLEKVNLVKRAMDMRADIIANEPVRLSVDDAGAEQAMALDRIRRASLFDALFHETMLATGVEGEAFLRVNVTPMGETVVCIDDADITFPVGEPGPDGQPAVFERRWIIERMTRPASFRATMKYLRVERHRVVDGVGVIEQEAYETETRDPLADLAKLKRVPLTAALPEGVTVPAERIATGATKPTIVQFVASRRRGEPTMAVNENTLDLIDASAAQLSSIARSMMLHGAPKARVPQDYFDEKTGTAKALDLDAVFDPEKEFEYVRAEFLFDAMLAFLDKLLHMLFVELEGSPSLIGLRMEGAGSVTSAEQLRIEAIGTLAAARRAVPYTTSALERLFDVASMVDASLPLRGYPVFPVGAKISPDLPLSMFERARDQQTLLDNELTSHRRAIAAIHGEDEAEAVLAEIDDDRKRKRDDAAASLAGAFGPAPQPPVNPETPNPETGVGAGEAA